MNIRTLIVEDEPLALKTLRDFIRDFKWLNLIGEATDGMVAVEKIEKLKPDLVFLDVQIPEISGLEVLRQIDYMPAIVFTTAFENYAVTAFELEALDYLQKPFGKERFQATIKRIKKSFFERSNDKTSQSAPYTKKPEILTKIFVRKNDVIIPLDVGEIVWLQAKGDYVKIHTIRESYLISRTLTDLVSRLNSEKFLRVHRSAIVNLDHIKQIEEFDRRLLIYMKDNSEVQASRSGSQTLKKFIA